MGKRADEATPAITSLMSATIRYDVIVVGPCTALRDAVFAGS